MTEESHALVHDEPPANQRTRGSLLSLFWTPLVAIGSSAGTKLNAQISLSTLGASIVPDRPRLIVVLYKHNFTNELIAGKGSFSMSVLEEGQTDLLHRLGFTSGRHQDKLSGLDVALTPMGNPRFPGTLGWLDCEVLSSSDLGDAIAYVSAVRDVEDEKDGTPMTWAKVRHQLPGDWLAEWETKIAKDITGSRETMLWH